METVHALQNLARTRNPMKIKILTCITTVYTLLWWMDVFPNRFYAFSVFCNTMFQIIFHLGLTNPNRAQFMLALLLGGIPGLLMLSVPHYSVFALCAHFICIHFGFDELNGKHMPYLFGSNTICWIVSMIYHNNPTEDLSFNPGFQVLNGLMGENNFVFQIFLGFGVNYLLLSVLGINKYMEAQDRHKYELKLQQLNKELESANTQLQKANRELQEALQEKENFILRFSHEIRNPLNSLLGNVELCYENTADQELKTMLQDAKVSGEILLQLLNNVLDAAKITVGRLEVSVSTHSIREFLEKVWVVSSEIIRKKRLYGCLSVNVNVPDLLEFDHHRVIQILINTISNAAKFTDAGHVKLFVDFVEGDEIRQTDMKPRYFALRLDGQYDTWGEEEVNENPRAIFENLTLNCKKFQLDQDSFLKYAQSEIQIPTLKKRGLREEEVNFNDSLLRSSIRFPTFTSREREGYIRLEIVDSGCGIAEEDMQHVFGKFNQVSGTDSKRQIGTGLGLWITKEIVELMKGKIELYSKAGEGSALVIMFKSHSACSPSKQLQSQGEDQIKEQRIYYANLFTLENSTTRRVLVVEDIPYNQEVNRKLLEKCGIKDITIASNGKEAFEVYLASGPEYFDLVLMDIDMPVMDGKTAVKLIRQEESRRNWPPVRIVFLTAYSESKTQQELLDKQGEYRADSFYSKPASLLTIQQILNRNPGLQRRSFNSSSDIVIPNKKRLSTPEISHDRLNLHKSCHFNQQSILVVDDDFFNLEMLNKVLKLYCKYHILEARNGEEAIRLYEENWKDIRVILMDCEMPILDGLEATRRILSKHKQKTILLKSKKLKIIGLTGHVGNEYKQKCLEAGMENVIEKPIKIDKLNALFKEN